MPTSGTKVHTGPIITVVAIIGILTEPLCSLLQIRRRGPTLIERVCILKPGQIMQWVPERLTSLLHKRKIRIKGAGMNLDKHVKGPHA